MIVSLNTLDGICPGGVLRLARSKTKFTHLVDGAGVYLWPDALTERAMVFEAGCAQSHDQRNSFSLT